MSNFFTLEEERDALREALKREVALTVRLLRERDEARARLNDLISIISDAEHQLVEATEELVVERKVKP